MDVPRHEEGLIVGAFTWGLLPGPVLEAHGKETSNTSRVERKIRMLSTYEEGQASKTTYLNAMATSNAQHHKPRFHQESHSENRYQAWGRRPLGTFRSFHREDKRGETTRRIYRHKQTNSKNTQAQERVTVITIRADPMTTSTTLC